MRDLQFRDYLVVGSTLLGAVAIVALWHTSGSSQPDSFATVKPSAFRDRAVSQLASGEHGAVHGGGYAANGDAVAGGTTIGGPEAMVVGELPEQLLTEMIAGSATDTGTGTCGSLEFRGNGPLHTRVSARQWSKVIGQFHEVKSGLVAWVNANRAQLGEETASRMEAAARDLRIQRPPITEEPDLNWRGIGALVYDADTKPILRVGSGLVKLVEKFPARAKFEIARLVAQAWAPCELERLGVTAQPWAPLLQCLNVEAGSCGAGSYSESGWAVSTAVAAFFAPPGCEVPALAGSAHECVRRIPVGSERQPASTPTSTEEKKGDPHA